MMPGREILARLASQPSRVVVMRALRLGDLICATPALRSLRALLPQAHITLIGLPLAQEFVRRCRFLDDFVVFPGYPGIADQQVIPSRTLAFLTDMQAKQFDLAIQLHGSGVFSNPFTVLLGAHYTIGFTRPNDINLGLDFSVPYPSEGREVNRLLTLLQAVGAPDTGNKTELMVLAEDRMQLQAHPVIGALLNTQRPLVGIHPGAKIATRRWMLDRFALVADKLIEAYSAEIVITGGEDEWEMCEWVRSLIHYPAHNIAGKTNLGTLCALIERLQLFITNDSGPAHLAAALDTPSITIFGAANFQDWAALDTVRHPALSIPVPCRPCYLTECPIGYICLDGITVDDVMHHATALLDMHASR